MYCLRNINVLNLNCRTFTCYRLISSFNAHLQQSQTRNLASDETTDTSNKSMIDIPDPLKHADFFGVHKLFTVRQLFDSRVHLGHKEGTLNPHMAPYLFGSRLGMCIFDLDQTAARLREALNIAAHIAFRSGIILFINRNRQTIDMVERTAKECGEYAHCRYWTESTLTDSESFYQSVIRHPDLVIFFSTLNNVFESHTAVKDAAKLLIPSIGIVDTNCDPTLVTYPVPGNDDTPCAIQLYCNVFKKAIQLGKGKRKEMIEKYGNIPM